MKEFALIKEHFKNAVASHSNSKIEVGIGDDAAILYTGTQRTLITCDMLVEGQHFLPSTQPEHVAHKLVTANVSDIAAMGGQPTFATLCISLPTTHVETDWLSRFSRTLIEQLSHHKVILVGGDTTKGPLTVSLTLLGQLDHAGIRRDGAQVGDGIFVSGNLGQAGVGLQYLLDETLTEDRAKWLEWHFCRQPRVDLAQRLKGVATAMIDLSDGLVGDLQHILDASSVGASLQVEQLPIHPEVIAFWKEEKRAQQEALISGEEYELCFTAPIKSLEAMNFPLAGITQIGVIEAERGLRIKAQQAILDWDCLQAFQHF